MEFVKYMIKNLPFIFGFGFVIYVSMSGKVMEFVEWYTYELNFHIVLKLIIAILAYITGLCILYKYLKST